MGKENIFSKAHTLLELEDMYMIALKNKQFSEEMLEQDYAEMRKKLLGTVEIEEQVSKRKTSPIKSITGYTNSKLELSLAWVKGNTELPSFNPVLSHERYSFPSSTIVIYDLVTNGAYFRDYIPSIQNNKLVIKISNKMREIVNIEQDIEIRIEEGENWKGLMFEGILQYSQLKDKYNVQIMTKSIDGIEITYQSYIQNIIN